jgi:hypothetical protein
MQKQKRGRKKLVASPTFFVAINRKIYTRSPTLPTINVTGKQELELTTSTWWRSWRVHLILTRGEMAEDPRLLFPPTLLQLFDQAGHVSLVPVTLTLNVLNRIEKTSVADPDPIRILVNTWSKVRTLALASIFSRSGSS